MILSSMDTTTSFSTFAPSSVATISAVSKSIVWLTEAITPSLNISLITSAAVLLRRFARSPTVISSGILTVRVFLALSALILSILSCSVSLFFEKPFFLLYCCDFCFNFCLFEALSFILLAGAISSYLSLYFSRSTLLLLVSTRLVSPFVLG